MSFDEIKKLNLQFNALESFQDFYDYLKSLSNNNKLNIKKSNEKISIVFNVEVLLKQQSIEIDLFPEKVDLDLNIKEMWDEIINIKVKIRDIDYLKNENMKKDNKISDLTNEVDNLKRKIKKRIIKLVI